MSAAREIEVPYVLEESSDLINWQAVRTNATPWTPLSIYTEAQAARDHQYFRATAVPPVPAHFP